MRYSDANLAQTHLALGQRPWTCVPLALFLRFAIMAAIPEVRMALCFGKLVVPIEHMTLGDAAGEFKSRPMVELTTDWSCYTWLWKQLGVSRSDFKKGMPMSLPLVQEIKASVSELRHKRKRDGKFYAADNRPIAESLAITVRGKQLVVLNDARRVAVNVGESQTLMNWFVTQLWKDLGGDLLAGDAPDEAEAEVDAPGPDPIEDVPGEQLAPGEAAGVGQPRADTAKAVSDAVGNALKGLRSDPHIRSAQWDEKHGRFRMYLKEGDKKPIYAPVKLFNKLVKREAVDMGALADALADALDSAHAKARPAAEAQPLEDEAA